MKEDTEGKLAIAEETLFSKDTGSAAGIAASELSDDNEKLFKSTWANRLFVAGFVVLVALVSIGFFIGMMQHR
jgi:hypothetical protein